jgi:hypothetical protein
MSMDLKEKIISTEASLIVKPILVTILAERY